MLISRLRNGGAFDGILSYLTFLDSVQTCNVPHIKNSVTAPEISLCMAEQISQEAMHNQSYQYIIETIVPSDRRSQVYEFWPQRSSVETALSIHRWTVSKVC